MVAEVKAASAVLEFPEALNRAQRTPAKKTLLADTAIPAEA